MGPAKRALVAATGPLIFLAAITFFGGCESTPNGGGGGDGDYNLVIVLEKNLGTGQDVIYVRFRRDNAGIPGGVVVIDSDTIATSSASGQGSKTYGSSRWNHNERIQIAAVDTSGPFLYRDSAVIPDAFEIDNIVPANRVWRPVDGNAQVSWGASIGSTNYVVSVKPRTVVSAELGLGEYYQSQAALAHIVPPSTFRDQADQVIEDVYDFNIVSYSPNFIARPGAPYRVPPVDDLTLPLSKPNLTGGIAALVVTQKDTLVAQTE